LSTVSKPENRFWPNHQNRKKSFVISIKTEELLLPIVSKLVLALVLVIQPNFGSD